LFDLKPTYTRWADDKLGPTQLSDILYIPLLRRLGRNLVLPKRVTIALVEHTLEIFVNSCPVPPTRIVDDDKFPGLPPVVACNPCFARSLIALKDRHDDSCKKEKKKFLKIQISYANEKKITRRLGSDTKRQTVDLSMRKCMMLTSKCNKEFRMVEKSFVVLVSFPAFAQ
jgi:hypothetical protein